jgi:guanylate kinase
MRISSTKDNTGNYTGRQEVENIFKKELKMGKTKPLFIVMSAPSGCGKSTLIDMLLQEYSDIVYSISCTTREIRGEEEDGLDYHFMKKERFEELIGENAFIEYANVHGNYYGTLKGPIEEVLAEGNSMILDIDVQGAAKVREYVRNLPNTDPMKIGYVDIFIMPPSMEELRARLEGRGTDSQAVIEKRLANAGGEIERANEYMYKVTNDDLAIAYKRLCDLIDAVSGRM